MEVAFFDRTGRGRLIVTGRDRLDLLHRLATNTLHGLGRGKGVATCFCTPKGRMIDYTVVLDRGDDILLLSGNPERLSGHIQQYTISEDVTVRNYMAIEVVVCGSGAASVLAVDLEPWEYAEKDFAGVRVQIVRIEALMGDAYAVLAPDAVALRSMLAERGRVLGAAEVDALRVEAGIPAFPNEINEKHNPWEAGLEASISLTKGCYIGQEVIARLNTYDKVRRRLKRVQLDGPFAAGDTLMFEGAEAAWLTTVSGSHALAYVDVEFAQTGARLEGATVLGPAMAL